MAESRGLIMFYIKLANTMEGLEDAKPIPVNVGVDHVFRVARAITPTELNEPTREFLFTPHYGKGESLSDTLKRLESTPLPSPLIDPKAVEVAADAIIGRIRRLQTIVTFAQLIIETYESEIAAAPIDDFERVGVLGDKTLADVGFCQGRIFKGAAEKIRRALSGEAIPSIMAYEPHEPTYEEVAASYDRLKATLVCEACGAPCDPMTDGASWRFNGRTYEHTHSDAPQAGHFNAIPILWYARLKANPLP